MTTETGSGTVDVAVVGAGPTGLFLAAELALAGVRAVVVEQRADPTVVGLRALGIHARSLELLAQRGVADRFVAAGTPVRFSLFGGLQLDAADLPSRFPAVLALPQQRIEDLLAAWVGELGVAVRRGVTVERLAQDADGVTLALAGGGELRARYAVGCDGGRSLVRKELGIAFPGVDAAVSYLLAEASTTRPPPFGFRRDAVGTQAIGPLPPPGGGRARFVIADAAVSRDEPDLAELRAALVRVYGEDFGVHDVTWISRFSDAGRVASAWRDRRVLLAGDAAHVHSPVGGQGLNLGLQDAANLGWKLARVVVGDAPEALLDTYFAEQGPVARRVVHTTLAQTALGRGDDRTNALRDVLGDLLNAPDARARTLARMTGLDVRHPVPGADLPGAHPVLGRRMPDLDLVVGGAATTVSALLHQRPRGRSVWLRLGEGAAPDADGADVVSAGPVGPFVVPTVGLVPPPRAALLRPDGHVAAVG